MVGRAVAHLPTLLVITFGRGRRFDQAALVSPPICGKSIDSLVSRGGVI